MIFYLIPPTVVIELLKFNESYTSRFTIFINQNFSPPEIHETLIPGTEMDKVGHFILRCFCLYQPEVTTFILQKEVQLFLHRLNLQKVIEIRKFCKHLVKDIDRLSNYEEVNPLTKCKEKPYFGSMLLSTLNCISRMLVKKPICEHFKFMCSDNCNTYFLEAPFQVCLSLVKTRIIEIRQGMAQIPCSKWIALLEELYVHHYNFGLNMISCTIMHKISADIRWIAAFKTLNSLFQSIKIKSIESSQKISFRQVDLERNYFPPCMHHLLNILRNNHRLTHIWRYYFSLFLKDIGLSVQDSLEFWKLEYTKSCSGGTSCTHSWQSNARKYQYSIRHLYGLEGAKVEKKSKSCYRLQTMQLGMRDEGGCPFVHFDDSNLKATLSTSVLQNEEVVNKIIELKNHGNPCEACGLHLTFVAEKMGKDLGKPIQYESPVGYYFNLKSVLNQSLSW